jgi:hypothetical protein
MRSSLVPRRSSSESAELTLTYLRAPARDLQSPDSRPRHLHAFRSLWTPDRIRRGNGAFEATYAAIVSRSLLLVAGPHLLVMIVLVGAKIDKLRAMRAVVVMLGLFSLKDRNSRASRWRRVLGATKSRILAGRPVGCVHVPTNFSFLSSPSRRRGRNTNSSRESSHCGHETAGRSSTFTGMVTSRL